MASILDRYGIKEVADLTFYSIDATTGRPRTPVLYIDTAKVSTVESTAETSYAEGGKGNGRLMAWDFGKEITMTIEDAVFSPKSLSIMFGDGSAPSKELDVTLGYKTTSGQTTVVNNALYRTMVLKVADIQAASTAVKIAELINKSLGNDPSGEQSSVANIGKATTNKILWNSNNWTYTGADSEIGSENYQVEYNSTSNKFFYTTYGKNGDTKKEYTDSKVFVSFYLLPKDAFQIDVGPDTYPGTYYITADTYARSEADGKDRFFQIIIPKGKITSENTLTMEADGDPTVFNMNVEVLRAEIAGKKVMMQLVQYGFEDESGASDTGKPLDYRIGTDDPTTNNSDESTVNPGQPVSQ